MPIIVTLDRVLFDKCMPRAELAERIGITQANLSILKTNKARAVRFSTLEAICRELNCQPADLLRYVTEGEAAEMQQQYEQPLSSPDD